MTVKATDTARCFAKNLRLARKRAGISQEGLAERAGLHRSEISLLERSKRVPRIDTAIKLAMALGVSLDTLAEGIVPGSRMMGHRGSRMSRE